MREREREKARGRKKGEIKRVRVMSTVTYLCYSHSYWNIRPPE